jgi:hypothetical protein
MGVLATNGSLPGRKASMRLSDTVPDMDSEGVSKTALEHTIKGGI